MCHLCNSHRSTVKYDRLYNKSKLTLEGDLQLAEEKDVHGDGDDHLDGQGRVETDGPAVEDDHEVEELGEAAQHDADELDPGKSGLVAFLRF